MKRLVTIELDIPDGATHYRGDGDGEFSWFKCKIINEMIHWFVYEDFEGGKGSWVFSRHGAQPLRTKGIIYVGE